MDQKYSLSVRYNNFGVSELYYSEITQKTVSYIEKNLTEDIQLDFFPSLIGYSKYHLFRVFKQETGKSIGEYIRLRRLALASSLLLHTDESIITIAIYCRFQSQEAFSRAFKEVYNLPPGKFRKLMRDIQMVKEENNLNTTEMKGWGLSGSNPELYELKIDNSIFHSGTKSGLLYPKGEANEQQFGTMMQSFQADNYKGKRIKMSCFLKTEQVTKCGAWFRVDNGNGDTIQFDNMENRSIHGTTEWNHYSIILDIPEESSSIHFGVFLIGRGKVWADDFRFEEVDDKVETTNMLSQDHLLPKHPSNLDFNE